MKIVLFFPVFFAFVAPLSTIALTADKISILNQNAIARQRNQEQSSDFNRLNQLLQGISINIDDKMVVSEVVAFVDLNLVVDSLSCRDLGVGNIAINHSVVTNDSKLTKSTDVDITINEIDAACDIVYQYEYGFLKGTGNVEVVTNGNAADISVKFVTSTENKDFAIDTFIKNCVVDIEINDINFIDADFALTVVGLFEKYLRDLVEKKIEEYACSQLSIKGAPFLNNDVFTMINDTLMSFATLEDVGTGDDSSLQPSDFNTTQMVNFREFAESPIGYFFQKMLSELKVFLIENDRSNTFNINNILNRNGVLVINPIELLDEDSFIFELHDELTETILTIEELRIYGLDSMTKFDPFVVDGDFTLRNEFAWETLNIEIDLLLDIQPSSLEEAVLALDVNSQREAIVELITIKTGAEKVNVIASFFALVDIEALAGLTIGSFLSMTDTEDYTWLFSCLGSAIRDLQFIELDLSPQQIFVPTVEGFIDDGFDRILSDVADIAFDLYHNTFVKDILPRIIRNPVKSSLNTLISKMLESNRNSHACPKYTDSTGGNAEYYVDFRELFNTQFLTSNSEYGKLPSVLFDLMNKELLENNSTTGMPKINEILIDTLTKGQSGIEGTLLFNGDGENIFDVETSILLGGFDADIRLSASNIKIENLDTIVAPLILFEPVPTEPHYLNNSVTIGIEDRPMRLAGKFSFAMTDRVEGVEISNNMDISFEMNTARVLVTMMLKIAKSRLLRFPLIDVFDLDCWVAVIPAPTLNEQGVSVENSEVTASVVDLIASVANASLELNCTECSSPGIVDLAELLISSEAKSDVTFLVNTLLLSVGEMAKGDLLQVQIDRILNDASKKCRHSPNFDPKFMMDGTYLNEEQYSQFDAVEIEQPNTYLIYVGIISLVLISVVAMLIFFIRSFIRRRHRRWLTTLSPDEVGALRVAQDYETSLELSLNSTTDSMFKSGEDIPCIFRWGMPCVILGNIALFLSGHLNLGATVNLAATIAGESVQVDQFFEFSMAKSTIDIWRSGGKALALLILIFSGIWPYTKQLITLTLWFAPTSLVPISRRGSILLWLDWLGKWSMIDIFVLIICLAAFRVSVNSPSDLTLLPVGFYSLDLLVVPLWGLYANMIAQLVSQLSSHFIIHYHRRIAKRARDQYLENEADYFLETREEIDEKVLLRTHQFSHPHRAEEAKLVVRASTNYLMIFLMLSVIVCITSGCILPSFSIEVLGLLGIAVEAGQKYREAKEYHSIFTVIRLLFDQAEFLGTLKNDVGLTSFSVIFTVTVLVAPILQSLALAVSWFIPITKKQRLRITLFIEILQSWQYAEVYIIAIFVASWQLGPISSFMVNSYCGSLDAFFSELVFYGILKTEDAQCFSIMSSIEEGFFILAVGSILLALVNCIVRKATIQYFHDQDGIKRLAQTQTHTSDLECDAARQEGKDNSSGSTIDIPPLSFTDVFRWLLEQNCMKKNLVKDLSCVEGQETPNEMG